MSSELKIFQEWIDYLDNICNIEDCGYSLEEAQSYIDLSRHLTEKSMNHISIFIDKLEHTFRYCELEFQPYKNFRRKKIIKKL